MPKLNYKKLISDRLKNEALRRRMIECASKLLHSAKKSIFAVHRADLKGAEKELKEAAAELKAGRALVKKHAALQFEGSWHAALEEYCEALLFYEFMRGGDISKVDLPTGEADIILGGLSDFTGELARQAIIKATERDNAAVEIIFKSVRDAVEILLRLNLTGSLRNKFDQAKQNLRKLEELRYEISRKD
ncbi:hypothetical protein KKD88_01910 [Patescibacteria group bacterium]|nr:hypothetical protein [Patescibacteria group bacterium]MBU1629809.1 hypothetical protein [Patescibacteria group bacterium]